MASEGTAERERERKRGREREREVERERKVEREKERERARDWVVVVNIKLPLSSVGSLSECSGNFPSKLWIQVFTVHCTHTHTLARTRTHAHTHTFFYRPLLSVCGYSHPYELTGRAPYATVFRLHTDPTSGWWINKSVCSATFKQQWCDLLIQRTCTPI